MLLRLLLKNLTRDWIGERGQWYLDVLLPGIWNGEIHTLSDEAEVIAALRADGETLESVSASIFENARDLLPEASDNQELLERLKVYASYDGDYVEGSYDLERFIKDVLVGIPMVARIWQIKEIERLVMYDGLYSEYGGLVSDAEKKQRRKVDDLLLILQDLFSEEEVDMKAVDDLIANAPDYARDELELEKTKCLFLYALRKSDLESIQKLFAENQEPLCSQFRKRFAENIGDFLKDVWSPIETDEEKKQALTNVVADGLITARAGSGKTALIALKVFLLIEKFKVPPQQILTIAFNTSAANEIGARINDSYFRRPKFDNYANFHQIAYAIAPPGKNESVIGADTQEFQLFKTAFKRALDENQTLSDRLYAFFREEMAEFFSRKLNMPDKDYYAFRRNQVQETLRGGVVKSVGEKWIADFLWEHGIFYQYEYQLWDSRNKINVRPDFRIHQGEQVWFLEHWAVDGSPDDPKLPDWFGMTNDQYLADRDKKIEFYKWQNIDLLETRAKDYLLGRENFENKLKSLLETKGIHCSKRPTQELLDDILRRQESRLVMTLKNYINRAKSNFWGVDELAKQIAKYSSDDDSKSKKVEIFEKLAVRTFKHYENIKNEGEVKYLDFSDLFTRAIKVIQSNPNKEIKRWGSRNLIPFTIHELRWVLIDEFQDFSPQFFRFIETIRKHNARVKIIGVGDDWQAINQFAGASDRYSSDFVSYFPNGKIQHLLTNYRSKPALVEAANKFMEARGQPSHPSQQGAASIQKWYADDVFIEARKQEEGESKYENDSIFRYPRDTNFMLARYTKLLKECIDDIWAGESTQIQDSTEPTILVLFRTNDFKAVPLNQIKSKVYGALKSRFEDRNYFDNRVIFTTAHKSKGLQAKTVIIVGATERQFPLIHPNEALNRVFGDGPTEIWKNEQNLFYVAVTRAKEQLHFLTETGKESPFLKAYFPTITEK